MNKTKSFPFFLWITIATSLFFVSCETTPTFDPSTSLCFSDQDCPQGYCNDSVCYSGKRSEITKDSGESIAEETCTNNLFRYCYSGSSGCTRGEDGKYVCLGTCKTGVQECLNNRWGACEGDVVPHQKKCDETDFELTLDLDCDGVLDPVCECKSGEERACGENKGICSGGKQTCTKGKWSACVGEIKPQEQEICDDGLDNNCDGQIDENCTCQEGEQLGCGKNQGECRRGQQTCTNGKWGACEGVIHAQEEICDEKDNNCDGQIDEIFTQKGKPCKVGTGICENNGIYVCSSSGKMECNASPKVAVAEVCNSKDDDCNGQIDDNITPIPCYTGNQGCVLQKDGSYSCTKECLSGTTQCISGTTKCVGEVLPKTEICDGKDNDCNGQIDEGCQCKTGDTQSCGSSVGICKKGTQSCNNGQWGACTGELSPIPEDCNNQDDDCNGQIDDQLLTKCSDCPATGGDNRICSNGKWVDCASQNKKSTQETCGNKIDDDCDGWIDEDCCFTSASSQLQKKELTLPLDAYSNKVATNDDNGVTSFIAVAHGKDVVVWSKSPLKIQKKYEHKNYSVLALAFLGSQKLVVAYEKNSKETEIKIWDLNKDPSGDQANYTLSSGIPKEKLEAMLVNNAYKEIILFFALGRNLYGYTWKFNSDGSPQTFPSDRNRSLDESNTTSLRSSEISKDGNAMALSFGSKLLVYRRESSDKYKKQSLSVLSFNYSSVFVDVSFFAGHTPTGFSSSHPTLAITTSKGWSKEHLVFYLEASANSGTVSLFSEQFKVPGTNLKEVKSFSVVPNSDKMVFSVTTSQGNRNLWFIEKDATGKFQIIKEQQGVAFRDSFTKPILDTTGEFIFSGQTNFRLLVFDTTHKSLVRRMGDFPMDLAVSPDEDYFAIARESGEIQIFDATPTLHSEIWIQAPQVAILFQSSQTLWIAANNKLFAYDLVNKTLNATPLITLAYGKIQKLLKVPYGGQDYLLLGGDIQQSSNNILYVYDTTTFQHQFTLETKENKELADAKISPTKNWLATVNKGSKKVLLWDLATNLGALPKIITNSDPVVSLDFTKDGSQILLLSAKTSNQKEISKTITFADVASLTISKTQTMSSYEDLVNQESHQFMVFPDYRWWNANGSDRLKFLDSDAKEVSINQELKGFRFLWFPKSVKLLHVGSQAQISWCDNQKSVSVP